MVLNKKMLKKITAAVFAFMLSAAICGGSVSAVFGNTYRDTENISVTIDVSAGHKQISPYIYGINSETDLSGLTVNALKQSGPRLSSYNWENNFSNNAGGENSSGDDTLVKSYPRERRSEPALYTERLVETANRYGASSRYVTLQMMGLVAADSSSKWDRVFFKKNDSLLSVPDRNDGAVYMDEYVSFLANKYGYAVDGGINGYFLDNEPENWSELYPSAATRPITADELISRSSELALAVKEIDPTALVYGPSINGIEAFINLKNEEDWKKHGQEYSWFIDYYLMGMNAASEKAGMRLLDVLDIHYHTEATNGLLEPIIDGDDNFSNNTRLQAPRILWDSTYTENSTIAIMHNQHIPLIPTLEASINMYYPGTKLSFSEYNFGGGGHISGGIATADTLGIFASEGVHMACLKPNSNDISYQKSGINIYTNYDGNGSSFGNTLVKSDNGGDIMSSVYAATDGGDERTLKAVLINKNQNKPKTAEIEIISDVIFESASVYSFDSESSEIVRADDELTVSDNALTLEMEPLTVYMLEFSGTEEEISVGEESDVSESEESDDTSSDTGDISDESRTSDENGTDTETSPTASETTAATPEHVAATTLSAAGTTASEENTGTEKSNSETTALPSEEETFPDETDESAAAEEDGEKKVPAAVKVIVILLVAAVAAAMAYVIIQDIAMSRKSRK